MNSLMLSPELYPVSVEIRRHLISFVPMSREKYRSTAFLDPNMSPADSDVYTFNLDDLLLYGVHLPNPTVPVHYVLHTAYCCSTLMARYLDLIQPCFVLREPAVLAQIAMLRPNARNGSNQNTVAISPTDWRTLIDLGVRLLTRTFASEDIVVVKVNDLCNSLGDLFLEMHAGSRIVFMYVPLRTFILSVLKYKSRRLWLRSRLVHNATTAQSIPALSHIDTNSLSDSEGAAFLWLVNRALYSNLRAGRHSMRVLAVDGERVAEDPKMTVSDVAAFLGLSVDEEKLAAILAHPSTSRYSKNMSIQYDANSRRQDLARMQSQFGLEADEGMELARRIKATFDFEGPWS
jgi:hypothetical protein